jgi:hypothetical protein
MVDLHVDKAQGRTAQYIDSRTTARTKRTQLHTRSTYEAQGPATFAGIGKTDLSVLKGDGAQAVHHRLVNRSFTFSNGQTIQHETLSDSWSAEVDQHTARLSPEQQARLMQHVRALAQAAQAEAAQPSGGLGILPDAMKGPLGSAVLVAKAAGMTGQSSESLVTGTAILCIEGQINGLIGNVEQRAQCGTELKAEVIDLQDMLNNWPTDGRMQKFSYQDMTVNEDGSATMTAHNNVTLTKSDAQNLLSQLQSEVDSAGSMTQTETFKMQMLVEQDQQAVNVISNILKISNDEMSAIIKNIKG